MRDEPFDRDLPRRELPEPTDDDFLYHLYRGSNLLMDGQVVEAKEELERALALQPQDAKSQDLLAGVYFRLGVYPRAIEIWERLVGAYPKDATLRVNLALALFKTGQTGSALDHVHAALRIQPDHERAWGYLGLIHWRSGRIEEAREAFLRGGQAAMARRMEDVLASSAGQIAAPDADDARPRRDAVRQAAEDAIAKLESSAGPGLVLEGQRMPTRTTGQWRSTEPGEEPMPRVPRAGAGARLVAAAPLDSVLSAWTAVVPEDMSFAVGPEGELRVAIEKSAFVRVAGIVAVTGELRTKPVRRRARGRELEALLGGDAPIFEWLGPVEALLAAPEEGCFTLLRLGGNDVLFLRESALFAFEQGIEHESASLPLGGQPVMLTQLHGEGVVVASMRTTPKAIRVAQGTEVRVEPTALVGWVGRLFPSAPTGTAPYSMLAPKLIFRGEGVVLVS